MDAPVARELRPDGVRGGRTTKRSAPRADFHALVILLALLPFLKLLWDGFTDGLGAEPVEEITHRTGYWALTLLVLALTVTPLRRLTGWNRLAPVRRTLGLYAFFYASLHVLAYFGLDQGFALGYIGEDILERPYITVGFTAWLLMVPLAVTSTRGWIRRLGRRWQRLHRLAYLSAALGVVHFFWLVKADADIGEPLSFGIFLAVILALRLPPARALVERYRTTVSPERKSRS